MPESDIKNLIDDLSLLINLLPVRIREYLNEHSEKEFIEEIVTDLGFSPEIRFSNQTERLTHLGEITLDDIKKIVSKIGIFNTDNRAGIERTLHRVSAIRNRTGDILGLTFRIGKAVVGTVQIIRDVIESGQNCLFLGPPGIGKTTLLRETARVLSDETQRRVIVVDTSNEIAGDGNIPHPGIGYARRMQVPSPDLQHQLMIEAVQNHMPEVIIVDEIGTEAETHAARTIAERGVQLLATAHGYNLESIIKNPILSDLVGGVQNVVLGDEEARQRGTNKTILERKTLPTFDVLIELKARDVFVIYNPVAAHVDAYLQEDPITPETRTREKDGVVTIETPSASVFEEQIDDELEPLSVFPYGISGEALKTVIHSLQIPVYIARSISEADIVLTLNSSVKSKSKISKLLEGRQLPLHVLKASTTEAMVSFFTNHYHLSSSPDDIESEAERESERACKKVLNESRVMELSPRPSSLRRLQHRIVFEKGLNSVSVGEDPNRRVRILPRVS
jgi:stage III sporulation protein AA